MEYVEALDHLKRFSGRTLGEGATPDEISAAEATLGVRFPRSYRLFLEDCGWASFGATEVFGLGDGIPRNMDLIRVTVWERAEPRLKLPRHLIPLVNPGNGDLKCLDLLRVKNGECPVVYRSHATGLVDQELAPNFSAFLAEQVRLERQHP